MSTRVFGFVDFTIRHAPEGGFIFEAFCVTADCNQGSGPQDSQESAQDWCLRHTGLNPAHDLFRRVATDHARVTKAQP
ncbi:hypothetical protein [Streptomyces sp. Cmuel-A718b]|uniref:DUF7848 domain-containing protein n=1 Tax=Streptomyces sp. Cmuel-A718b TaxID=697328 RepID=UPI00081E5E21|nr:hypothetical protein [Streptomyces sp. Cmuel-A718b]SCF58278.1 hypothetical protein GA0115280_102539 [Streptomyces sp. Cmuel-A718b]